jgi:Helix-turn-helix family
VTYFAPESHAAWAEAGIRGFWRGYFATRTAPLGAVPAATATAVLYNFAPAMVARALPGVWAMTSPAAAWAARLDGVDRALVRALGADGIAATAAPAALARAAAGACGPEGRALFAAHLDLDWPAEPHLALWHALTLLREFRGDGHNAALLAAGIDGCQAHVLAAATGRATRAAIQPHRGWDDAAWDAGIAALADRGLVATDGTATPAGHAAREAIEAATDRAGLVPWDALGDDRAADLRAALLPLARAVVDAGMLPVPNPMGAAAP